jgi:hypothetical protein
MSAESIATQLEAARATFLASPSVEGEEAIEQLEREQRKAERFAQAQEVAAAKERAATEVQAREAARAERLELLEARADIRKRLRLQLGAMAGVVDQLHAAVADIERACNEDFAAVERLNAATRRARVSAPHERAISLAEMRVAVGIFLRGNWREPPIPHDAQWGDLLHSLTTLVSVTGEGGNINLTLASGSNEDIRDRLRAVQFCFDNAIGDAELARWVSLQPEIRSGAAEARRCWQSAYRLLQILEDTAS